MTTRIKLRRDTAANWTSANPILAEGEPGLETDTLKVKYGDGTTQWNDLDYSSSGGGVEIGEGGEIQIGNITGNVNTWDVNSIAIGTDAGIDQSTAAIAIGHGAGNSGQDRSTIAIGRSAGESNQDWNGIAIGRYAGATDQGQEAIAIGKNSGNYEQGQHSIAIGKNAGNYQQNWAAVAIGEEAGETDQSFRAIAIGRWAGNNNQGNQAVAVGALSGKVDQGDYAIAIGRHAGEAVQGDYAIAIGQEAGMARTPMNSDGYTTQNWVSGGATSSTTMVLADVTGVYPGMSMVGAGTDSPSYVTAVNTGTNEITFTPAQLGDASGSYDFYGEQGEYAIAIGAYAGRSIQHPNSVIINATGEEVNSAGTGTVVIKTVRNISTSKTSNQHHMLYDVNTGEVVSTSINFQRTASVLTAGGPIFGFYFNVSSTGDFNISNPAGSGDIDIIMTGTRTYSSLSGMAQNPVGTAGIQTLGANYSPILYPTDCTLETAGDKLDLTLVDLTRNLTFRITLILLDLSNNVATFKMIIEQLI